MATLTVGSTFLLSFVGKINQQTIINTFWYRVVGAPTPNTQQITAFTALDAIVSGGTNLFTKYRACIPTTYQCTERVYQVVAPTRFVRFPFPSGLLGTSPADGVTANLAGVVTRGTDSATRKDVGSLHVPVGTGDEGVLGGLVIGATKNALNALAVQMKAGLSAGGYDYLPVIGPGVDGAGNVRFITRAFSQSTARVMRRRTVGLGI